MSETIKVVEGEAPLMTFHVKTRLPDGSTQAFDVSAADEILFRTKVSRDDASYEFSYSLTGGDIVVVEDGTTPGVEFAEITVQADASDLDEPRNLWYRLDVETGARLDTIKRGLLEIANA